jgi:tryptophanyl-tRNA synthetase
MATQKRLMSGMRPTGRLHIGNYFGALSNWLKLQGDYQCFFSIVDWHAMTDAYKEPKEIALCVRDFFAEWVAWGLDPEKNVIFVQSAVPEILELHMIFSNLTPMGWLERVTTWKDAQEELKQKEAHNLGRFAYPVLQTADIGIFAASCVPVGRDQVPHLELSREIIRRTNFLYGTDLPEPEAVLTDTPLVMGSDGRKMSKSYGNIIPLTPEDDELKDILRKMPTDPARVRRTDPGEPTKCPVYGQHKLFSSAEDIAWVEQGCRSAGIGCGDCKNKLRENMTALISGPREKKKQLLNDAKRLDSMIQEGCRRARLEAQKVMASLREKIGLFKA